MNRAGKSRVALTVLSFSALVSLALGACGTREDNGVGIAFIEDQAELKAVRDTFLARPDTSTDFQFTEPARNVGAAVTILIGERPDLGYRSRALVRFDDNPLPDSGVVVTDASIELVYRGGIRDDEPPTFTMALHRVISDWSAVVVDTTGEFPDLEAVALDSVSFLTPEVADTLDLPLTELVQRWIDVPDSNFGIALVPVEGTGSLAEFGSSEGGNSSRLRWVTDDGDSSSIERASSDTFLLETIPPFTPLTGVPGRMTVGRGFPSRSIVRFELPDFGERVTINRAELTLHVDPLLTDLADSTSLTFFRVADEEWMGEDTRVALTLANEVLSAEDDSIQVVVTELVTELVRDGNFGFLIRATDERRDVDFVRFHSETSEDPFAYPTLRVWYTPGDQLEVEP